MYTSCTKIERPVYLQLVPFALIKYMQERKNKKRSRDGMSIKSTQTRGGIKMKICKASSIPTPIYSQYSKDAATGFVYTLFFTQH